MSTLTTGKIKTGAKELVKIADVTLDQGTAFSFGQEVKAVLNQMDEDSVMIDILLFGSSPDKVIGKLPDSILEELEQSSICMHQSGSIHFRIFTPEKFPIVKINQLQPCLKLVVYSEADIDDEDFSYAVSRFSGEAALLYFCNLNGKTPIRKQLISTKDVWQINKIELLEEESLLEKMAALPDDILKMSVAISGIYAVKRLEAALQIHIENEQKDLDAKKMAVKREMDQLKSQSSARTGQEVYAHIKNNVQKSISEFEKGIGERLGQLTKAQQGSLFSLIEDDIESISTLDEKKENGETRLVIPEIGEDILDRIRVSFSNHLSNDVASLNDFFEILVDEINKQFKEIGFHSSAIKAEKFQEIKVEDLINDQVKYEKEFDAKGLNKGFMSLFSAARQPVMMIVMSISVAGYFVDRKFIQGHYMFPVIIAIALLAGIYFAISKTKKEKLSKMAEEVKKAQQYLKNEVRKILTNLEKEWKAPFNGFMKKHAQEILEATENELRNFQHKQNQKVDNETMITQKKMQTINMLEKRFQAGLKDKANFGSKLRMLSTEVKQEFLKKESRIA